MRRATFCCSLTSSIGVSFRAPIWRRGRRHSRRRSALRLAAARKRIWPKHRRRGTGRHRPRSNGDRDACRSHPVCARLDRVATGAGPARMVRHQHRHVADARRAGSLCAFGGDGVRGRRTTAATLTLGLVLEAEVAGDRHALRAPFRWMPAQILLRIERVLAKLIGGLPGPSRIEQHGAGKGDHIGLT